MKSPIRTISANLKTPPTELASYHGQRYEDHFLDDVASALNAMSTYVVGADSTLISSNGASQTTTVYQIDLTTGNVVIGGVAGIIAALDDKDLLNVAHIKSYQLDGTAAVALTADGKTYEVALVAILVSGAVEIRAIFGAEAADAAEVAPTNAQIRAALAAASITGYDAECGLVFTRIKIQRVAVDTITMTHAAATTLAVLQDRLVGSIGWSG
jgi:hypothetical protein